MSTFPPDISFWLFYDGQWNDITPDARLTEDHLITLGRPDEASSADPSSLKLRLNNGRSRVNPAVSGRYSPKNPRSDLFGKIGKNTPIRLQVGDPPADPDPELVDTFDRTESDGWGTADTGQGWVIYDFAGATPTSDYSVADGTGRMSMPTTSETRAIRTTGVDLEDVDATFTVATDQRTLTSSGLTAVFGGLFLRVDPVSDTFLGCAVWFAGDSGLPDGQGLRVATSIVAVVDGVQTDIAQGTIVPNLVYAVDEPLRVRVQVEGSEVRMRVWADGGQEPAVWHSQAHTELVTQSGEIACLAQINAFFTEVPVTVHFGDLSVREPTDPDDSIRDAGEISEWPARWDISDSDVWVPVDAQGILRRLNQGDYPIRSLLRRYIASLFPVAYWSFEETGTTGARRAVTAVAGGQSLRIGGFKFGEDGDVPGSDPLPMVLESTGAGTAQFGDAPFMRGATVPAVDTEAWSVFMLLRLPSDDYPESGVHQLLRFFSTGTAFEWILTAENAGDAPFLRLQVLDSDGAELGNEIASHVAAVTAGEAGLLDDWRVLRIRAFQDGANADWRFDWLTLDGESNWGNGDTFAGDVGHFRRVSTTVSTELAGMRFGHLSAWGNAGGSGAYFNELTGLHAALGFEGESARERTRRLLVEEGIPSLITGAAQTPMGPQLSGDFAELLREPADADLALLGEQREAVAVAMRARETLYNQDPVLVLDYANGEIFPPIDPIDDDQRTRNAVTVTRKGGSFAEAIQETGQLNIQNPEQDPDGVGRYPSTPTINVADDDQLPDQAGWRLHLGTVDELRYPRITLKLGNERMRDLIEDVMRVREGDLIRIINPPDWLPADDIDLIVEGYEERVNAFLWEVTLTCSPASPWTIAHVTQTGTLLSDDFEDADRSIAITDGGDAAWFRTMDEARFGDWSFRSGVITDDQTSDAIVEVPDQAVALSFWYKVDSEEDFDFFRVFVGDDEVLTVSGDVDWQHSGDLDVTTASTVTFRYEKDAAVSDGADAAFIDDVVFSMIVSGPDLPDRADTAGSVLVYDVDEDDADLVVHTSQPVNFFAAEWIGAAQPISANGDFEEDLDGWTGVGATIERVLTPDGAQFGGFWSVKITPDGVAEFPNAGSDLIPVVEGRMYVANGWLRSATTRVVTLSLNWFDGGPNFLDVDFNDKTIAADTWTWFQVVATAPAGAAFANLAPTVPDFPPDTDVAWADEVWLRPVEDWSDPQEVPFDLRLSPRGGSSGEVVQAHAVEPLLWDTFTRPNAVITLNDNPDFEENLDGWSGFNASIARVASPGAPPFPGVWSVEVTPDGVSESVSVNDTITEVGTITPGEDYTVSSWAYSPGGWPDLKAAIDWFDADGNYLATGGLGPGTAVAAGVWTFLEQTLTAPANASRAAPRSLASSTPSASDIWDADEIRLTEPEGTWGTSDSGHAWQETGGEASDRTIDEASGSGVITLQANPSTIRTQHVTEDLEDCEVLARVWVDQVATGASLLPAALLRRTGAGDFYRARVHFGTGGSMFTSVTRGVTQIGSSLSLPWTYAANDEFFVRVRLIGHRVLMRVWPVDRVEPVTIWHNDQTVTTEGTIDSGAIGVAASGFAGNTNTDPELHFGDVLTITPQQVTVIRGLNGVQIDHDAGTDVRLARPPIVAL